MLLGLMPIARATNDVTAPVGQIQGLTLSLDCYYFTLAGVALADSMVSGGGAWFSIVRSQFGAKDAYAILLIAKATGASVRVTTSGGAICGGYAQVNQVILQ